jgi:trimethylamine:corrinoid methyltransferase-like protein
MGNKDMFDRAREKKEQILENYEPPEIDPHILDEMKRILMVYAEKKGETIPEFIFDVRPDI